MGNLLISPPDQRNHGNNRRQKQYNKKEPNENQQKGGKRINGWQPEMLANCVCVRLCTAVPFTLEQKREEDFKLICSLAHTLSPMRSTITITTKTITQTVSVCLCVCTEHCQSDATKLSIIAEQRAKAKERTRMSGPHTAAILWRARTNIDEACN